MGFSSPNNHPGKPIPEGTAKRTSSDQHMDESHKLVARGDGDARARININPDANLRGMKTAEGRPKASAAHPGDKGHPSVINRKGRP
jgi:hypothetical protein